MRGRATACRGVGRDESQKNTGRAPASPHAWRARRCCPYQIFCAGSLRAPPPLPAKIHGRADAYLVMFLVAASVDPGLAACIRAAAASSIHVHPFVASVCSSSSQNRSIDAEQQTSAHGASILSAMVALLDVPWGLCPPSHGRSCPHPMRLSSPSHDQFDALGKIWVSPYQGLDDPGLVRSLCSWRRRIAKEGRIAGCYWRWSWKGIRRKMPRGYSRVGAGPLTRSTAVTLPMHCRDVLEGDTLGIIIAFCETLIHA